MNKFKTSLIAIAITTIGLNSANAMNLNITNNLNMHNHIKIQTMDLSEAKSKGFVGEKPDGLLVAVKRSAEIASLVTDINKKRMDKYQQLAKKHGVSVLAIQKQAAKKILETMPKGQHYMTADGKMAIK